MDIKKRFHPSPTMQIKFGNGRIIAMNRRERRRNHLYGDRLIVREGHPSPPPVFHSLEEMKDAQSGRVI